MRNLIVVGLAGSALRLLPRCQARGSGPGNELARGDPDDLGPQAPAPGRPGATATGPLCAEAWAGGRSRSVTFVPTGSISCSRTGSGSLRLAPVPTTSSRVARSEVVRDRP